MTVPRARARPPAGAPVPAGPEGSRAAGRLADRTGADELMLSASTYAAEERVRSLELVAQAWGLEPAEVRTAA